MKKSYGWNPDRRGSERHTSAAAGVNVFNSLALFLPVKALRLPLRSK